ncbi:HpcH/HpaI aldolase family protein [Profundibacterium mesophilum]|uniref:24-dihydroxyhept-2-ene-17-dioic acid aldolase n=1 Tax=Profundibacterium mesophilum KAUST100406-0324 TaxID=1037889 RepID=A0A921NNN9_9RHOB|nr:aldolase/citrate lyase family protein [Profundibacterium mesophilum]KAF0675141.1 24-dihydroxyhept-2-ene-17-dioic acid aldolase [Profundibacterium mesophilum KAUST100406-0324]
MQLPRNMLKDALKNGRVKIGLWMGLGHPAAAEIASRAGFDWCLIDGGYGSFDTSRVLAQLQAMDSEALPVLRVPRNDSEMIRQALDLGVQTIVVPMVETAEQAAEMAAAMRNPPQGTRRVGTVHTRASGYGAVYDCAGEVNDEVCLFVQIESETALRNLPLIAACQGVDGILVGADDLAASMGHTGRPNAPQVQAAITEAARTVTEAGKILGMIASSEGGRGQMRGARRDFHLGRRRYLAPAQEPDPAVGGRGGRGYVVVQDAPAGGCGPGAGGAWETAPFAAGGWHGFRPFLSMRPVK